MEQPHRIWVAPVGADDKAPLVEVREAHVGDAGVLAELGATVQALHFDEHPERFKPPNPAGARDYFGKLLENPSVHAFIAEHDGIPRGYVVARVVAVPDTPFTWAVTVVGIDQIGVVEEARRQGVGRALFGAVVERGKSLGAERMELVVWDFNATAQAFFTAQGVKPLMLRMVGRPGSLGSG